jgi:hypothetical protein
VVFQRPLWRQPLIVTELPPKPSAALSVDIAQPMADVPHREFKCLKGIYPEDSLNALLTAKPEICIGQ